MAVALTALSIFLVGSLVLNILLHRLWKKALKAPAPTAELQEFLAELMGGKLGMIAVARVDQTQLLYRSPKGS